MQNLTQTLLKDSLILINGKFCLAFFSRQPILSGHSIITNKGASGQYSGWSKEEVEQSIKLISILNKKLISCYKCPSTTVCFNIAEIQNQRKTLIHIIPRFKSDIAKNDQIYEMIKKNSEINLKSISFEPILKENQQKQNKMKAQFELFSNYIHSDLLQFKK